MPCALRLLAYRARSEAEMRQRLQQKGFAPPVVDHTLAELARLGLLDDRDFAASWVQTHPGHGGVRLRQALRQKGIYPDLAEEVVNARSAREELASAWQIAERAVRSRPQPLAREELLRVQRLLQRRGFTYAVIQRVCARLTDRLTVDGEWLEE